MHSAEIPATAAMAIKVRFALIIILTYLSRNYCANLTPILFRLQRMANSSGPKLAAGVAGAGRPRAAQAGRVSPARRAPLR